MPALEISRWVVRAKSEGRRPRWLKGRLVGQRFDPAAEGGSGLLIEKVVLRRWKDRIGSQAGGTKLNPKFWVHLYEVLGPEIRRWRKLSVEDLASRRSNFERAHPDRRLRLPKKDFDLWLILRRCPLAYIDEVVEAHRSDMERGESPRGLPDLFLYQWTGKHFVRAIFVEVKGPGDRLSKWQRAELDRLERHQLPALTFALREKAGAR